MDALQVVDELGGAALSHRNERTQRLVAGVEDRAAHERGERLLEAVVHTKGSDDDVRLVEVAAESRRPPLERGALPPAGEVFEKVLDQVLLRQPLQHLDLLDGDGRLVRDRARQVDLAGAGGDERAEQLAAGDERDGHPRSARAPAELGAELRQPDRCGRRGVRRRRPAEPETLVGRVEQIEVNVVGAEQVAAPPHHLGAENVERVGDRDGFRELGEMLELADALSRLVEEPRVLDRARDERRARDEKADLGVGELAGGDGVEREGADRVAALAEHRDRDERLEFFLLELRHVLHARVAERVLADERGLAAVERPPGKPFATLQLDLTDEPAVRFRCGAEHESLPVPLEEIDEAGVDGARVGEQLHDAVEHLLEIEG